MGAGASSVVVRQPHVQDAKFKELLSSREARNRLFNEISVFKVDDHITLKGKISYKKMVGYFSDPSHALYPGFDVNGDILNEAFRYTLKDAKTRKKKKNKVQTEQISLDDFHKFLPVLLLFDRLWDLFDAADRVVIEDKKVFKGEFVGIYDKLHSLSDVLVLGTLTKEQWLNEFSTLDKNGDGYISFPEFCDYCVAHIERPFDFKGLERADSEDEEDNSEKDGGGMLALSGYDVAPSTTDDAVEQPVEPGAADGDAVSQ